MKRTLTLAVASAAILALAGCGSKKDLLNPAPGATQPLTLMLDYFPNADHVGIFEAQADGVFKQAGLNVHIEAPSDPSTPLKLLEAGKVDVAISYEPDLLLARNQGAALVSVAAIVQRPLTSIISLGSKKIRSPSDLHGKTVGTAGIPYQSAFLSTILQQVSVPASSVKTVNVGENLVPALISGRVDATLGAYWNYEAIQLRQLGRRPNVIHVEQAGVPSYDELVFAVRESTIVNHPDLVRRFVQAVARGYRAARADPQGAVSNLLALNPNAGLNRRLQLASVRATLPAFFPTGGEPWGFQSVNQWNAFGQWMMSHHLISNPNAIDGASTDELLAGQGL